jgi:PAS domain S-box-containing protein
MAQFIKRFEVRITVIFGVFSTLWIIFSDTLTSLLFGNNPAIEDAISIFKGIAFVLTASLGLYFLLSRELRKRGQIEQELQLERDISPVAIMVLDADHRIAYANVQAEKLTGKPRLELVGQIYKPSYLGMIDYESRPVPDDYPYLNKVRETHQSIFGIQQALVVDGKRVLLEFNIAPIFNRLGQYTGAITTFTDVTEAKAQEKRLKDNEGRFRLLFNNNPMPMWVVDIETLKFLEVNDAAIVSYGYSRGEFLVMSMADIRPAEDVTRLMKAIQTPRATFQHLGEWRHILKNGQVIDVDITTHHIDYDGHRAILAVAQDITERKQTERALRASEESLKRAQTIAQLGDWTWDLQTNKLRWSDEMYRIFGVDQASFTGDPSEVITTIIHPDDRERVNQQNAAILNHEQPEPLEYRVICPDGSIQTVWAETGEIVQDAYGNILSVSGIVQDITEHKQAEHALRESEVRFRLLFNNNPLPMWVFDLETLAFLEVNAATTKHYGYSRDEFLAMKVTEIRPQEEVARLLQHIPHIHQAITDAGEWRHVLKDGREIDVQITSHAIEYSGHSAVLVVAQDISQRKQAEQALRESEASLKRAQMLAHVGDWTWNVLDNKLRASEELYRIFGIDPDHFSGDFGEFMSSVAAAEDIPLITEAIQMLQRERQLNALEFRIRRPDGMVRDVWAEVGEMGTDADGNVISLSGIIQDITDRKHAEKALSESEARYRMLIEQASDSIFIIDGQDRYIEVNPAACNLLGYTREEILSMRIPDLVKIPKSEPLRYQELQQGKTLFREREMMRKDGSTVQVEFSTKMLPDGNVQAIGRDITERRRAEEELRLKSTALESAANGIAITNVNGIIQWVNPAFADLTGYAAEDAPGHNPRELVKSGVHNPAFYKEMWQTILSGKVWRGEIVNRRKNGSLYTEDMTITPVRDSNGEIKHFIAIKQDITDRKLTEAALQRLNSELEERVVERTTQLNHIKNRIESILNSTVDSILYSRIDGMIEQVNLAFSQTFGYQPDAIWLKPLTSLVIADDVPALESVMMGVITGRQAQHTDVTARRSDGTTFDAAVMLSPVIENKDQLVGIVASIHDITNRNHMLRHAMDLSELKSRYVSMAAHDLRNPMAVILSASETLEHYYDRMDAEKKLSKYGQIRANIKIMTDILDDVLLMGQVESGKLVYHPAPMDVIAFCQSLISEMGEAAKTNIHVEFSSQGVAPFVSMDAKLLRHILGNLLSNAIKYSVADKKVYFSIKGSPEHLTFTVQDQGIGIPQAEQAHLFETFHRAQNAKNIPGTGLGLAIVKQSVDLHGGTISFESEEGKGTTFTVCLPDAHS